jgi:hypothetical protein
MTAKGPPTRFARTCAASLLVTKGSNEGTISLGSSCIFRLDGLEEYEKLLNPNLSLPASVMTQMLNKSLSPTSSMFPVSAGDAVTATSLVSGDITHQQLIFFLVESS